MIKAFDRWSTEGINVDDKGIIDYINLKPTLVPRTGARYAGKKFHKSKIFIVERLINKIMVAGHKGKKHFKTSKHTTGKAYNAYKIVEETFDIIEKRTKENPIKVFVKALENAAPREEIVTIEHGGARYPKAVECAPQRRIDVALKHIVQGSYHKAFNSKTKAESALANEIITAYSLNPKSHALNKKNEIERQADASR